MAKEATLQVRMDADVKERVEALYHGMGTSFAEIVRILAVQSLIEEGVPFQISTKRGKNYGALSDLANPDLRANEEGAFGRAMAEKHAEN